MMWVRKLLIVLLLLLSVSAYSEPVFHDINWDNVDQSLNTIELNFQMLKIENNNLQTQLTNVGGLLLEREKYSAAQSIQLETLESNYAKLEKTTKLWKIGCCSFMITTISTIIALIITK